VELVTATCTLRPWRRGDATSLVEHANDPEVARNLRERFPQPYTRADADGWIAQNDGKEPATNLAITVDGIACGGIGLILQTDIERCSAELGYWLGRTYWGRGIASDAARAMTAYAFEAFGFERIFATAFGHNVASQRVLEKAGYTLEGVMRRAAIKDDVVIDKTLYAKLRDEAR
jgi:ribosomal-protein-alanine N-acetyltransferase